MLIVKREKKKCEKQKMLKHRAIPKGSLNTPHMEKRPILVSLWLVSFLVTAERERARNIPVENVMGSGLGISEV